MNPRLLTRGIGVGLPALALGVALARVSVGYASHTLRKEITDLLGPTAWGIYFIVPIPFLVVGVIALLLYRAARTHPRKAPPSSSTEGERSNSGRTPEHNPGS